MKGHIVKTVYWAKTGSNVATIYLDTCTLRSWRDGDEFSLSEQANNRKIWDRVRDFFPHPYTVRDASSWIRMNRSYQQPVNLAIDIGGKAVGNVGFTIKEDIYRHNAEIGYWLGESHWGQGIMTEVLPAMVNYIFTNFQVNRLFGCVLEGNSVSMRVLEQAGFRPEAVLKKAAIKNNQYLDEHIFAILREEFVARQGRISLAGKQ
ncbi:GNAT family N-acetyltransferase [Larkinella rosea]|uniref:GNAT family N-acetyltransferase n=1 Tax=Larkinella rosea TaxID=2025312 RepID=UPI001E355B4D|nr:GNAT family protein [Larkinella rosea]